MSKIRHSGGIGCLLSGMLKRSLFSLIACVSTTPLIQSEFDKCCWLEEDSSGILHSNFENSLIFLRHCLHSNTICDELESHYCADTLASAVLFKTAPGEMRVARLPRSLIHPLRQGQRSDHNFSSSAELPQQPITKIIILGTGGKRVATGVGLRNIN